MKKNNTVVKIFADDEMNLVEVRNQWSLEELLSKEGVFFLKDIVGILSIDSSKIKLKAREIQKQNQSAWRVMGARKIWSHWVIRMKRFAPYYIEHLQPKVQSLKGNWNGNLLLKQKGVFFLTEVCRFIPFSAHQLRYQAKRNPNAREEFGVWKDEEINAFVVEMELFSKWINRLWDGHFQ